MLSFLRIACWSVAGFLAITCSSTQAALVANVLTLDSSRNASGRSEDFGSSSFYNTFRGELLSTANFGPAGVLNYSVNLLNPVASVNAANLSGANVVIWSQRTTPTASEKTALANFVSGGGGLMVISDASPHFADLLGGDVAVTNSSFQSRAGLYSTASTPMTNGAFGNIAGSNSNALPGASYYFAPGSNGFNAGTQTGIHWGDVSNNNAIRYSEAVALTGMLGSGRIALFGDDDMFIESFYTGASFGTPEAAINRIAAKNTFSWLANGGSPTAVPEPASVGLVALLSMATIVSPLRKRLRQSADRSQVNSLTTE